MANEIESIQTSSTMIKDMFKELLKDSGLDDRILLTLFVSFAAVELKQRYNLTVSSAILANCMATMFKNASAAGHEDFKKFQQ